MKEEHETRNYNGVFHSNSAELYSWAKAIIVSFLCTRRGRRKMRRKKRRWRRRKGRRRKEEDKEEEKEIRTRMQSFAAMQHSLLMGLGYRLLHFLVKNLEEEEEEEEEGIDEELAVLCFSRM